MRDASIYLSPRAAETIERVFDCSLRIGASPDLATVARRLSTLVEELIGPVRVHCLFHDAATGALWTENPSDHTPDPTAVGTKGVVGLAIATASAQVVECCAADPRWCGDFEERLAGAEERVLVQPLATPRGEVDAVLVAVRTGRDAAFSDADLAAMALLAECTGPLVHNLGLALEAAYVLRQTHDSGARLFRGEAVEARRQPHKRGDVVRVLPEWLPWTYRLLMALALLGLAYLVLGRVDVYSSGPAVVRLYDRSEVTAHRAGSVVTIEAEPGQNVAQGEVLARFDQEDARGDLERLERAWGAQLRRRMSDPLDSVARDQVARLWEQLADARAALADCEIRAPFAGVVSDLRIRSGQFMSNGDVLLSISRDEKSRSVVALVPGRDRPRLRVGMVMRLEFPGYPRNFQYVVVDAIGDEVIGPAEARRFLGPSVSDAMTLAGSLVVVEASLPQAEFTAGSEVFRFHDGMNALAEVRVQSKPIVELLIPGLEGRWTDG